MNRRILLIDPDPAFQAIANRELGRYRVVVMIEADGERAVPIALADPPAVIVVAVDEPEKLGFKVFQKCKKSSALAKVPIVLVTSSVSASECVCSWTMVPALESVPVAGAAQKLPHSQIVVSPLCV